LVSRILGKLRQAGASSQTANTPAAGRQPQTRRPQQRPPRKLNLDASQFLPIERDELLKAAKGLSLWASPWFGRRDLIPPADDQRTGLIDRALITHGLLTPEQLAEIHDVGAEMDKHRPHQLAIRHAASIEAGKRTAEDRAEKARIKKEKKQAAAERREQRRAAIAHRKATDITFLGRGVSGRMGRRDSNAEQLQSRGLPVLSQPAEVAAVMGLTVPRLRWLAFHTTVARRPHYIYFQIPKRSGGNRTLSAPHQQLAQAQRWILDNVLRHLPVQDPAHGFVSRRSILTNARPHVGKDLVINIDLEDFFPGIGFPRVRGLFERLGYSSAVATIFALLCCETPRRKVIYDSQEYYVSTGPLGLPQGACTSPAISNQITRRLDRRLLGLANKLGISYTRYADDLTFSGDQQLTDRTAYVMACVRHIASDEGFRINQKKTRVLRRSNAQSVTGLIVNDRPGANRKHIRRIRSILHRAQYEGLAAQNRENHPNFNSWLAGHIAYISMARPEVGRKFREQFDAIINKG
jgi:retron-type reverse transcriptase